MKTFTRFAVLPAVLLLVACSSVDVQSQYDHAARFDSLMTWDWLPGDQPESGDPWIDNEKADARLRGHIAGGLAARGFDKVSDGAPDFYVGYRAALDTQLDAAAIDQTYGYSGLPWDYGAGRDMGGAYSARNVARQYEVGTLVVDIIDPVTRQPIWRGSVQGEIDFNEPTPERSARVREAVGELLAEFPPR